jgi:DNA-binding beta-propeller fold protein YncE
MKLIYWRRLILTAAILIALAVTNQLPRTLPEAVEAQTGERNSSQPPETVRLKIETIASLGVPAGNGASPRHLALNSEAGELYILSQGIPALEQGNGLSVYNLEAGNIVDHVKINEGVNEPLELQFDPGTGLIYALWREQFGSTPPTLSIIDSQTRQVIQEIPGVDSMAGQRGRLYTANQEQLAVYVPQGSNLVEVQRTELPAATTGPLAINTGSDRLYLVRNAGGTPSVEIFEANNLAPLGNFPVDSSIVDLLPLPQTDELLVVTAPGNIRTLNRLTTDGQPIGQSYELGPRIGAGGVGLSQDGQRLYFGNGQLNRAEPPGPALVGISTEADLPPLVNLPLLSNLDDIVVDDTTNQLFALYAPADFLYVIDLVDPSARIVNTAIELRDVLFDEENRQIYVSDSANRIRRLDADSLNELAQTPLQGNIKDFGFNSTAWAGELALDRARNRLGRYTGRTDHGGAGWPVST